MVGLAMLGSSLLVYLLFLREFDQVLRFWDGPHYLYLAKTLYAVPEAHPFTPYGLPPGYFASHLPLYPLLIRLLALPLFGDYRAALIVATLATAVGSALLFHQLLREYEAVASATWTAVWFCFVPTRWLLYHSVGATEPLFFCCLFAALIALRRGRPGWVAFFVSLATLTRISGVLLVGGFALAYLLRRDWRRAAAMVFGLAGIGLVFLFHQLQYGDFLAYARWNIEDQGIVATFPLAGLARALAAGNARGADLYIGTQLVYGVGLLALWRKQRDLFAVSLAIYCFLLFVVHRDVTRYYLAIAPFALLVGYDAVLAQRASRAALALAAGLAYLYAWIFLPRNGVSRPVYEELLRVLQQ